MRLFHAESPAHEDKFIIARSYKKAAEIIVTWHIANGIEAAEFSLARDAAIDLRGNHRRGLDFILSLDRSGMARFDDGVGWVIHEICDERPDTGWPEIK